MEPIQPRPQRPTPGRPQPGGIPARPRPLMSDFGPVRPRPMTPQQPTLQPTAMPRPAIPHPATPAQQPAPSAQPQHHIPVQHAAPVPTHPQTPSHHTPYTSVLAPPTAPVQPAQAKAAHEPERKRSSTGHAGLVGFVVFIVVAALLASPFLPGKVLDNFPGSTQSSSDGAGSIACIEEPSNTQITKQYTRKLGAPLVYTYTMQTTESGTCQGKQQSVVTGTSTQFNPLALVINLALAFVVAYGVAFVWRLMYRRRAR